MSKLDKSAQVALINEALKTQSIEEFQKLKEQGVDIHRALDGANQTAFILAVYRDYFDLAKWLLENGANTETMTKEKCTALFYPKTEKMAQLLLDAGANIHVKNKKGNSILYYPITFDLKEVVALYNKLLGYDYPLDQLAAVPAMSEKSFWDLVVAAQRPSKFDEASVAANLVRSLRYLDPKDILAFHKRYQLYDNQLATSTLWAAAYLLRGGCSDDAFTDFRSWLIGQGADLVQEVQNNPDALLKPYSARKHNRSLGVVACSSLQFAAPMAYEIRTGGADFWKAYSIQNISGQMDKNPIVLDWDENNLEALASRFPKIYKAFL